MEGHLEAQMEANLDEHIKGTKGVWLDNHTLPQWLLMQLLGFLV